MTKNEKLIERIRARPPEADCDDVWTLMKAFGWTIGRGRGSQVTFVKEGQRSATVPKQGGRKVKRVDLDLLCDLLGLDE